MSTHVVMGRGTAPSDVITSGIRDVLREGDDVAFEWVGSPVSEAMEAVYSYVLDNDIEFTMFYTEGQKIPGVFREAEFGRVNKTRDPFSSLIKSVDGNILYLWDDDDEFIERVFDSTSAPILELSNGLVPIVLEEAPAPEPSEVEDEEDEDMRFTKEQLESMAVPLVKRYGERMGCDSKTKSGIIDELFGSTDTPYATDDEQPVHTSNPSFDSDLVNLIGNFFEHYKPGFSSDMAHLALGQARLWMLKALSE